MNIKQGKGDNFSKVDKLLDDLFRDFGGIDNFEMDSNEEFLEIDGLDYMAGDTDKTRKRK